MNKILVTILGLALLLLVVPQSALADESDLVVEFEDTPLFSESDFKPGDSIIKFIKVTNNTGDTQPIAIEAINQSDPDEMASSMDILIKEGSSTRFSNTLEKFFEGGETLLSDLAGGGTLTQYDVTVSFNSSAGNDLQGKALGFDLIVGFQGAESGGGGGGGGGGGPLPPGLTILEDTVTATDVGQTSVTIIWTTSYSSTSQVVYAADGEGYAFELTPPNYGYPHATADDSTFVTNHSVTITGLTPGTTYHYRVISHASPATISFEHAFTTLGIVLGIEQPLVSTPSGQVGNGAITGPSSGVSFTAGRAAGTTEQGAAEQEPGEEGQVAGENIFTGDRESEETCVYNNRNATPFIIYALLVLISYAWLRNRTRLSWYAVSVILTLAAVLLWYYASCVLPLWLLLAILGWFVLFSAVFETEKYLARPKL
ncbi:MAG: fibronectin type III domain-containing protein [Candidatus Doudnabacteria bacterium]|nr:fibronectin type III domain-containing protein [Candidatus Doudnabacteria bacterium]